MKLILATHNSGKLQEFERILAPKGITVQALGAKSVAPQENGDSLDANSLIKANAAYAEYRCAALADDSGLFVDALGGLPGIHSARYAGVGSSDEQNRAKLLREMANLGSHQRDAEFRCVICLVAPELFAVPQYYLGIVKGRIATAPKGNAGFGYDSLFVPDESDGITFAEMSEDEKNAISHRARAIEAMVVAIDSRLRS